MSSFPQDHLLVEGPEPVTGTRATLNTARGTTRRPVTEQALLTVPAQRQGKSQRTGSTPLTTADGSSSPVAASHTARPDGGTTAGSPAPRAKAAAAKPAAAKPARVSKHAAVEPVSTPAVRPTPRPRTSVAEPVAAEVVPVVEIVSPELSAAEVVASVSEGRRVRGLRSAPPSIRRRPVLYLAAALVGAISVSGFSSGDPSAVATENMSHSVSVAQELGIAAEPTGAITDTQAVERLGELAVSRNERGADQAAAAQAQTAADQAAAAAAAEAARPQVVLPVAGARLTSTFGVRWGTLHAGIDLAAPMHTPEMAAMDGVVLEAGPASGFGLAVYIQHANGDVTLYGHMDQILVSAGQVVKAGDTIALLGDRGQSTGPHLHFEVHVGGIDGHKIDPLPWLRERGVAI